MQVDDDEEDDVDVLLEEVAPAEAEDADIAQDKLQKLEKSATLMKCFATDKKKTSPGADNLKMHRYPSQFAYLTGSWQNLEKDFLLSSVDVVIGNLIPYQCYISGNSNQWKLGKLPSDQ